MEKNLYSLSVVAPVYHSAEMVEEFVYRVMTEVIALTEDFEIILIDDGSRDNSWRVIDQMCAIDKRVKGIRLSRNYGQHYAITAGLEHCNGDYAVVMDADLQHDPVFIKDMVNAAKDEFDIVYTVAQEREHPFFKNFFSRIFYRIFNLLTDSPSASKNVGSYSLLSRKAVTAFRRYNDYHRHYLLIVRLLGFRQTEVSIIHYPRKRGKSAYTFRRLIAHAVDGITSQSNKLLRIIVAFGFFFVMSSFIATVVILYLFFQHGFLPGWTSLIVLILLCTGVIMVSLGVIGIYISKIFDQVKNRPLYLVDKMVNFDPKK
jgi:polyisoprenyl-phosphate glycosyltransferase